MQNVTKYNIVLVKQRFGNINYGSTTVYSYVDIDFQQNVRIWVKQAKYDTWQFKPPVFKKNHTYKTLCVY